jgi:hypothetical protein
VIVFGNNNISWQKLGTLFVVFVYLPEILSAKCNQRCKLLLAKQFMWSLEARLHWMFDAGFWKLLRRCLLIGRAKSTYHAGKHELTEDFFAVMRQASKHTHSVSV